MMRLRTRRRGFSYIEVTLSLVILSTAIAASLRGLGAYAQARRTWQEKAIAIELAAHLMAEINQLPFGEPSGATTIGVDAGENASNPTHFDDIDDYNGCNFSPPKDRLNKDKTDFAGYRQKVTVEYDNTIPAGPAGAWTANTFKKITVRILKGDRVLSTLVAVRSKNNASK